ncbi:MAG: hypothetical protein NWE93_04510 [Candidatus Bathyarchaeota archaeon]|nr:hypothetical protein [Candidatus Bathyarchaeota archaeon]
MTEGKIKNALEVSGPRFCSQQFGTSARKHLCSLSVSKQESLAVRKSAIEALILVGIDKTISYKLLEGLPNDLKDTFYTLAFSATANNETKESIIYAAASNTSSNIREEVSGRIHISPDPDLPVLLEKELTVSMKKESKPEDHNITDGLRANYVDMLASKLGSSASQTFSSILKDADPSSQVGLVDRLVDHLTEWSISGPEYEDLLIKKFQELKINQSFGGFERSLFSNSFEKMWGWKPDPLKQIIEALSQVGQKKALAAMIRVLIEKKEDKFFNNVHSQYGKDTSDNLALLTAVDSTQLGSAVMGLFQRLKDEGQLPPLGNVAEKDIFRVLLEKLEEK